MLNEIVIVFGYKCTQDYILQSVVNQNLNIAHEYA